METHQLFINGRFVASESEEMIDILNPSTEEVISKIPKATEEEVNQAVEGAASAQKEWEQMPAVERAKIVRRLGDELENRKDTFVSLLQQEQGKNYELANGEVDMAIDFFRYTSEWARRIEGDIVPSDRPNENILIYKKPIGVVAGIVPWNFPVFILARKVAQALTTGCTLVLKPSQQTPNTAYEFTKMVDELDFVPDGVYQYVTGTGSALGNQLASHPKVDMISITGSVTAGTKVMEAAAQNITKVNLELGGKAPAIVTANADLDLAVEQIKASRLLNNGQTCTNAERVYVQESVAEEFTEKLKTAFEGVSHGNPAEDHDVEMGPLVSQSRLETVEEMVVAAIEEGADCIIGGKRAESANGYFYEPTILTNVQHDSDIIKNEIFGPVVPIVTFTDLEEAIEMGNDTDYGLSSSVYTEDIHETMKVINELKFGETYVNRENMEAIQGYHAGIRKSGLGGTDGKHGIEDFLITQAVYMQYKK
ncbi:lactaldehyde dehydrogenase / glycolaldehyde dehydrogenase [Terribacillus halophilus]|uniref:3-sulfolactaldehyde dehydrogenase n=1 Tax=Terribacillus halophilus TaxID=361279 RepID=A0A1G6M202_9BACI|nr:aldehyde dehydrogenase [Terribacillus halophilus]SDC49500.1 lactaldehyde dehydrogenase / glycolaldehyde dehydrogenase [Terribacillus halophilus]